jgi:hypothetical protein
LLGFCETVLLKQEYVRQGKETCFIPFDQWDGKMTETQRFGILKRAKDMAEAQKQVGDRKPNSKWDNDALEKECKEVKEGVERLFGKPANL